MNELAPSQTGRDLADFQRQPDQDPAAVYLAGLAHGSRRTMRQALDTMAQIATGDEEATCLDIPWPALRFQHTAAIRAELASRYSHNTTNKMLSALRGVLKAAWKLGQMSAEDYNKAASVENVRGQSVPAGRSIAGDETQALLATCEDDPLGIRDAAMIAVLLLGLRRAELVSLDLGDYDQAAETLRVQGKRNKQRLVPVVGGAGLALADWLRIRGSQPGPLFYGLGNRNSGGRLSTQAVYAILRARSIAAGVDHLTPHDFRRTFVSDLLDAGADIVTVRDLAGHASVETTARYDRRGERAKRKAAELLRIPTRPGRK